MMSGHVLTTISLGNGDVIDLLVEGGKGVVVRAYARAGAASANSAVLETVQQADVLREALWFTASVNEIMKDGESE